MSTTAMADESLIALVGDVKQSRENKAEEIHIRQYVSDCLAAKMRKIHIQRALEENFGRPFDKRVLDKIITQITEREKTVSNMRRDLKQIKVKMVPFDGRVLPEVIFEEGFHHTDETINKKRAEKLHNAAMANAIRTTYVNVVEEMQAAHRDYEVMGKERAEGRMPDIIIERMLEHYRNIVRMVFPLVATDVPTIKDRDTRLAILGSMAFDPQVEPSARIQAVVNASRLVGDFQKARANEHDVQLKQAAERIVAEGMRKSGLTREKVIMELAKECPEIHQWLTVT